VALVLLVWHWEGHLTYNRYHLNNLPRFVLGLIWSPAWPVVSIENKSYEQKPMLSDCIQWNWRCGIAQRTCLNVFYLHSISVSSFVCVNSDDLCIFSRKCQNVINASYLVHPFSDSAGTWKYYSLLGYTAVFVVQKFWFNYF